MELDKETNGVILGDYEEYLVIRNALGTGLKLVDLHNEVNQEHPSFSDEAVAAQRKAYDAMPTRPTQLELPYTITGLQAHIALRGLRKAGPKENPLAREKRQVYRNKLAKLLKQA